MIDRIYAASTPGGIEVQEARDQQDFVNSTTLPRECIGCDQSQLETMGIRYGKIVDDQFVEADLPEGWAKVPTNHSMWSKLVDEQGRERAAIFYKAAFYDRHALISLTRRYNYQQDYRDDDDWQNSGRRCIVKDCGETIWASDYIEPTEDVPGYMLSEQLNPQGEAWLEEHYPDWRDPLAYWETP